MIFRKDPIFFVACGGFEIFYRQWGCCFRKKSLENIFATIRGKIQAISHSRAIIKWPTYSRSGINRPPMVELWNKRTPIVECFFSIENFLALLLCHFNRCRSCLFWTVYRSVFSCCFCRFDFFTFHVFAGGEIFADPAFFDLNSSYIFEYF